MKKVKFGLMAITAIIGISGAIAAKKGKALVDTRYVFNPSTGEYLKVEYVTGRCITQPSETCSYVINGASTSLPSPISASQLQDYISDDVVTPDNDHQNQRYVLP